MARVQKDFLAARRVWGDGQENRYRDGFTASAFRPRAGDTYSTAHSSEGIGVTGGIKSGIKMNKSK